MLFKRFLSVLCTPFEYEQTVINASIENEYFTFKGNRVINLGFRENYKDLDDNEDYGNVIVVKEGEVLKVFDIIKTSGKTNPPSYLNEGSLLTLMEKNNLGTVATKSSIIEKLFNTFVVEKKGKEIHITSKGRQTFIHTQMN